MPSWLITCSSPLCNTTSETVCFAISQHDAGHTIENTSTHESGMKPLASVPQKFGSCLHISLSVSKQLRIIHSASTWPGFKQHVSHNKIRQNKLTCQPNCTWCTTVFEFKPALVAPLEGAVLQASPHLVETTFRGRTQLMHGSHAAPRLACSNCKM